MLDWSSYQSFYSCYRDAQSAGGFEFKKNNNWKTPTKNCLCKVQPTNTKCIPSEITTFTNMITTLEGLNIHSIYGPDHKKQADAICTKLGANDKTCCHFKRTLADYPSTGFKETVGFKYDRTKKAGDGNYKYEIGLKQLSTYFQNAYNGKLCKYSSTFATDGWTKTPTCFDPKTAGATQTYYWQTPKTDSVCDFTTNKTWMTTNLTNVYGGAELWKNSRTHYNMVGYEDNVSYFYIKAQLGENIDTSTSKLFPFVIPTAANGGYSCVNVAFTK